MTVAEVREKWNQRYRDKLDEGFAPEPNPLALRLRDEMKKGGVMLDVACGLGPGIAAVHDLFDHCTGVDLSNTAIQAAKELWREHPTIEFIVGDVSRMSWPQNGFDLICAFGYTDWAFMRKVSQLLKPGGLFLYQGFSQKQLAIKPDLDPDWTSTPESVAALFPGWTKLVSEESNEAPFRVSFAARSPEKPI